MPYSRAILVSSSSSTSSRDDDTPHSFFYFFVQTVPTWVGNFGLLAGLCVAVAQQPLNGEQHPLQPRSVQQQLLLLLQRQRLGSEPA